MKIKTQRILAVGGGTVFCAALAVLIATRFAPNDVPITTSNPETESKPGINLVISTSKPSASKPTEKNPENNSVSEIDNLTSEITDPEKEAADFIENGGIEIRQDFTEPEKKTENSQTANNSQTGNGTNSAPTEAPKVTDENALTDPTKEPTYDEKQTVITPTENSDNSKVNAAMHGQKKDGMIYITGFGWVKDNGGGGRTEYDGEMYENGNKIGSFG